MTQTLGLCLIVDVTPGEAVLERIRAVLAAAPISSAVLKPAEGEVLTAASTRAFVDLIQKHDVAALIAEDAALARTLRADGVHLASGENLEGRLGEAREVLGQRYIVGGIATSKHDAMVLGEGGCDYVAFEGEEMDAFLSWWSEIFEIPCVAFGVTAVDEAVLAADCGADFIAFHLPGVGTVADAVEHARHFAAAISDHIPERSTIDVAGAKRDQ